MPTKDASFAPLGAGVLLAALVLLGCHGHHHHSPPFEGDVVVVNETNFSTLEDVLDFRLAPPGLPFSSDLLAGPLPPGFSRFIGTFGENFYDATSELSGGDFYDWFDEFVGEGGTTEFVVF